MTITKNDEYIVDIADYGMDGEGIAKINNMTIFVQGTLKKEKCKIHITKVLKNYAYAKVIEVLEKSPSRVDKDCSTYPRCGGCSLRHISYDETLKIKKEKVQNLANKMLKSKSVKIKDTLGMEEPLFYRNKAIYPITKDKKVGIYAKRSHEVVPFTECKIQTINSQRIAKYIIENWKDTIYDEKTKQGILRNIMIREGFSTNEIMVVLVQNGTSNLQIDKTKMKNFDIQNLIKIFPNIKTIVVNVNIQDTNVILSNKNIVLYGNGYIIDELCGHKFKISPNSFYQVNAKQTENLYNLVIEQARLNEKDILCDLYCGIGTIGIIASRKVKKVYGIEIVKQAIVDARENANINSINNIEFINEDVETAFDKLLKSNVKPDVVIVDPPRKGLDRNTTINLCKLKLQRLVYVSCNPATLMRDLQILENVYNIETIIPVDNFCYSSHIETVSLLTLKKDI